MGRPSKYKQRFCTDLIEFYDQEPYEDMELPHYNSDGTIKWKDYKRVPKKLPTVREFSKSIGVGVSTIYDWLDKNHASYKPEFSEAYTHAKDLQKWFLIQNGLQGLYNPAFAKFTAINITDMIDHKKLGLDDATVGSLLKIQKSIKELAESGGDE